MTPLFPPSRAAALARLAAVRPSAYASSRNQLGGAVTRLSPYLTHGLLSLPEVAAAVANRHALPLHPNPARQWPSAMIQPPPRSP